MKKTAFLLMLSMAYVSVEKAEAQVALAQAETARGEGEVRKVDKGAGKITIKHGPLDGINMPAMTMVFRPKEPSMLDNLKEGDQIRFTTSRQGGAFSLDTAEKKN